MYTIALTYHMCRRDLSLSSEFVAGPDIIAAKQQLHLKERDLVLETVWILWARGSVAGMTRFQNGGPNQCISFFTAISSPENKY